MKLLIVDDEYYAVQGVLDGVNWEMLPFEEVLTAGSFTEAVEIMSEKQVDVLLSDIEMPDESGLFLIEWVNQNSPDTLSLIMSCHDEFDYARQAITLRCFEYLLKPIRYEKLTEVLKRAAEAVDKRHEARTLSGYGKIYIGNISKEKEAPVKEDIAEETASFIERNLAEDLNVRALADRAYVSADHLTRLFKKKYGVSVTEYIYRRRMILAGELLKDPKMTVTMVSDLVGYRNYSYFTDQFKRYYNETPREYMQKMRKGE